MVTRRVSIETETVKLNKFFELAIFLEVKFGLLSCCMLLVTCVLKYSISLSYQLLFESKYSSGRVVAKLAWIKVLVGKIRIGPCVGQRFRSQESKRILGRREFWLHTQ